MHWTLCRDFVRLCGKDDEFRARWIRLGEATGSGVTTGPYTILREELNSLGWRVEPPMIVDHDGLEHSLLDTDPRGLDFLLRDAWCQRVSERVRHRHLMKDLNGIDMILARSVTARCTAQDAAILAALQSGTFLSAHSQSKFDLTKNSMCSTCGVKNDHVHWLQCPKFHSHHTASWPLDLDLWPLCLKAHLLPPTNPHIHPLKLHLHTLRDGSWDFMSGAGEGPQHLFTDGSAFHHQHPWLSKASWAVLNASTGAPIAASVVPGLLQTNDVAELWAIIAALQWSMLMSRQIHIWTDSKFAADSLAFVLQNNYVPMAWENRTAWLRVLDLLEQLNEILPHIHWIPSHIDPMAQDDPFAEWWSHWNGRVDRLAVEANLQRGQEFEQLHRAAMNHHEGMKAKLELLAKFYCAVAHQQQVKPPQIMIPDDITPEYDLDYAPLSERLPLNWRHSLYSAQAPSKIFLPFCVQLVEWIMRHEIVEAGSQTISLLELVFALVEDSTFSFPFTDGKGTVGLHPVQHRFVRPTLAYLLTVTRQAIRFVFSEFDFGDLVRGLDRTDLGVHYPCDGIALGLSTNLMLSAQRAIRQFSGHRPLRKACDLARPM